MATALKTTPQVRDQVSPEEWAVRVDLAAAYRLIAAYGWDDLIFTHILARVPGPEHHFLINPYTHMFEEMTASALVKIDVEGNKVMDTPSPVNQAGFVIHSAIHSTRNDATAVPHLHTPHGQAVSAMADGLLPHTRAAMIAGHDVAYHDFEGIATELDERERLVQDLGTKHSMILRNHGTLTVGKTVRQAFLRMYFLERACEAQVLMLSAGRDGLNNPNLGVAEKVQSQSSGGGIGMLADGLAWPALLRELDRLDPAFRESIGPVKPLGIVHQRPTAPVGIGYPARKLVEQPPAVGRIGDCQDFCVWRAVEHYAAMALMKRSSIGRYLTFYNSRRPHSSLDRKTPDQAYFNQPLLAAV